MFTVISKFFSDNFSAWIYLVIFALGFMYYTERSTRISLEERLIEVSAVNATLTSENGLLREDLKAKAATNEAIALAVTEIRTQFQSPLNQLKKDLRDIIGGSGVVSPGSEIDSAWVAFTLAEGDKQ